MYAKYRDFVYKYLIIATVWFAGMIAASITFSDREIEAHISVKEIGKDANSLSNRELAVKFLKAFICLPAALLILALHNFSELMAGVKTRDKLAKLKD